MAINTYQRQGRYTLPVSTSRVHMGDTGIILDARVHGPWTRVSFFDTRVDGS